jgi:hypothetical protein
VVLCKIGLEDHYADSRRPAAKCNSLFGSSAHRQRMNV